MSAIQLMTLMTVILAHSYYQSDLILSVILEEERQNTSDKVQESHATCSNVSLNYKHTCYIEHSSFYVSPLFV
jgi:hypothetical protein